MRIGPLDRLITIDQRVVSRETTYGTEETAWVPFAIDVPANIEDELPSRSESLSGNLQVSRKRTRVRVPYMDGINGTMRIRVSDPVARTMQLVSEPAMIGGRMAFLEFMVEEYSS